MTLGSGDSVVQQQLLMLPARDDLVKHLASVFDQEVFEEAMNRCQARVQPQTWEAFRLTALEGMSGADAASQLGMQVAAVFVARSRVMRLLKEEVNRLESVQEELAPNCGIS
jgi:RNA polymerase sigma-70 factor (ECF subfamily)